MSPENLKQLGELALVRWTRNTFSTQSPLIVEGIGDDAAAYYPSKKNLSLLTTDLCIEGVHFNRQSATMEQIGYKALASNLSDIAAMGGKPVLFLVSVALPSEISFAAFKKLYQGMKRLCRRAGVQLIGGDTSESPNGLFICITVIGEVSSKGLVSRSGAEPGDRIFVTGTIGDAGAGLDILRRRIRKDARKPLAYETYLIKRHLLPVPRIQEGNFLSLNGIPHAMIDLSDGLSTDLSHVCKASGVGAEVNLEGLPLSPQLTAYCSSLGRSIYPYAFGGGEDYELLFTVPERKIARLKKLSLKKKLKFTEVGRIISKKGLWERTKKGLKPLSKMGFEHFRKRKG